MIDQDGPLFANIHGPKEVIDTLSLMYIDNFFDRAMKTLIPKWKLFCYRHRFPFFKVAAFEVFYSVSENPIEQEVTELVGRKAYVISRFPTFHSMVFLYEPCAGPKGTDAILRFRMRDMAAYDLYNEESDMMCLTVKVKRFIGFIKKDNINEAIRELNERIRHEARRCLLR